MAQQQPVSMTDRDLLSIYRAVEAGTIPPSSLDGLSADEAARLDQLASGGGAAPSKPPAPEASSWTKAARGAGNVALGVARGAGRTAYELGRITRATVPTIGALSDAIMPNAFAGTAEETFPELRAQNPQEEIGVALERLVEFLAPGGAITRAGRAVQAIPSLGRAAKLATRVGVEALPAAAITALQREGSPGIAAAIAGAAPMVGAVAAPLVGRLTRGAQRGFEQALNPTTRRAKADAARIAIPAIRSGVRGSLDTVAETARKSADTLNDALDAIWVRQGGRRVPVQRYVDGIEQLKAKHLDSMGLPLTPDDAKAIEHLTALQTSIAGKGPNIDLDDVRRINRRLASDVAAAGGYSEKTGGVFGVNLDDASRIAAKRDVSGVYRKELVADIPEAAPINKALSLQLKIKELADMTRGRKTGQKHFLAKWMPRLTGAAIGTGSGVASGDSGFEAAVKGFAGAALSGKVMQLMDSSRWHLFSARNKLRLADALASESREALAAAVARLTAEEVSTQGRAVRAVAGVVR